MKVGGPGIPSDRVDRIFGSFTQVDASITRQFGGTGLGTDEIFVGWAPGQRATEFPPGTGLRLEADEFLVVQPGETYSLNGQIGIRTAAKGYKPAGAIIGGELYCCDHWLNIGGGVSQFSTTLYNAIFFAGLEEGQPPRGIKVGSKFWPLQNDATSGLMLSQLQRFIQQGLIGKRAAKFDTTACRNNQSRLCHRCNAWA